ncbi:MAG: hypothetical protein C5B52_16280 [Bacteroidetes bacterium]|nr:MAG: hypothetical protein C5B52_16280 [Bacteroidota bacterium]
MPTRSFCIITNPLAGKGKPLKLLSTITQKFSSQNISFKTFENNLPDSLNEFTDLLILGGDGTLQYTLNFYKQIPIAISIIPCGTGNDFSWVLHGDKSLEELLEIALNGTPTGVDAGSCNGRIFLNGIGIGFDGEIAKLTGGRKKLGGHISYLLTVLKHIFRYREKQMNLEFDGVDTAGKYFMVAAANGQRYGGGFKVSPFSSIHDGELNLLIIHPLSILKRLRYLPLIERGRHLDLTVIEHRQIKKLKVTSNETLTAHLDGEVEEGREFEITVLPTRFYFRH